MKKFMTRYDDMRECFMRGCEDMVGCVMIESVFERVFYVMLWGVTSLVFGARVDRQDPVPHDHFSDGLCGAIH